MYFPKSNLRSPDNFDAGCLTTDPKRNWGVLISHLSSYYQIVMDSDKFTIKDKSDCDEHDIIAVMDYILACIFSVKHPCKEKEIFQGYFQSLAQEDQDQVNEIVQRILGELNMDHEKSLNSSSNLSFESNSSSPYTTRQRKKIFEDKIEYLEDTNIKLNERISTLMLELEEGRKQRKKSDEVIRILKASNKKHETKLNEMEEKNQSLEKLNEEYITKNLEMEENLVKITQEKLSKIEDKVKTPIKERTLEVQCESLLRQIEELKPYKDRASDLALELHAIKKEKTLLTRDNDNIKIKMNENDRMYSTIQILQKKLKESEAEVTTTKKKMDAQKRKFSVELREAADASTLEMNVVTTQFYTNGMQKFKSVLTERTNK
jgi:chromosome segregation ATPase